MEKNEITKDWYLAAVYDCSGVPFVRSYRLNGTCYFVFSNQQKAAQLREAYLRGDLTVNARELLNSQRFIKDLIHEQ